MADGIDKLQIDIEASAQQAMPVLDLVIDKLTVLADSLNNLNTAKNVDLSRLLSQLQSISKVNLSNLNFKIGDKTDFFQNLERSINNVTKCIKTAVRNISKVSSVIKNAFGSALNASLNGASAAARTVGNAFKKAGSLTGAAFSKIRKGAVGALSGLKSFFIGSKTTDGGVKDLIRTLGGLFAKIWSIKKIASMVTSSAKKAMDFVESYHYFDVAFRKIGEDASSGWSELGYESAEAYADSFKNRALQLTEKMSGYMFDSKGNAQMNGQKNLGLDPNMLMNYQAQFAQMANGLGMTADAAERTSKALTMLGADWSSLRNIDFSTSYEKMASALAGQSRAVRSLGIDITQATLQQYAYNAGLETTVTKMTQAQKAELRMIAILDQSKVAWGDMAETLNTPANQYRLLQQNIDSLARTLGSIFIPILKTVLPYINGVVIALKSLVEWIAKLVGADIAEASTGIGGISDAFVEMPDTDFDTGGIDGIADAADDAADAVEDLEEELEEAKRVLFGFDEMNVLPDKDEDKKEDTKPAGSGNTGAPAIGNIGDTQKLDSYLGKLLDEYELKWQAAFDAMTNRAQEIADKIIAAFKSKDWEGLGRTIADLLYSGISKLNQLLNPSTLYPKIDAVTDGIAGTLNGFFDPNNALWTELGKLFANAINAVARFANGFFDKTSFENIGRSIGNALKEFIEDIDAWSLGEVIGNRIKAAVDFAKGFLESMKDTWGLLGQKFSDMVLGALSKISGKDIAEVINLAVQGAKDFIAGFKWTEVGAVIGSKIADLFNNLDTKNMGSLIANAINAGVRLARGFLDETRDDWDNLGAKIGEFFNGLVGDVDPAAIGSVLSDAVNGAFHIVRNAVNTFEWDTLSNRISTGINTLIHKTEWDNAGKTIGELAEKAMNCITDAVNGVGWTELGTNIGLGLFQMVNSIDDRTPGLLLESMIQGVLDFLNSGLNKFRTEGGFEKLGRLVGNTVNSVLGNKENWDKIGETLDTSIQGALQFLIVTDETINWDSIADNVHTFIMNAVESKNWDTAFTALDNWFGDIVNFLKKCMPQTYAEWEAIGSKIHDFISKAIYSKNWGEAFGTLLSWVEGIVTAIGEALPDQEGWAEIGRTIGDRLSEVDWESVFTTVIGVIKEAAAGLFQGLGDTLAGKIILGLGFAKVTFDLLSPFFLKTKGVIRGVEAIALIGAAAKDLLVGGLTVVGSLISSLAGNVGLTSFVSKIASAISGKASSLANTFSGMLNLALTNGATQAAGSVASNAGITTLGGAISSAVSAAIPVISFATVTAGLMEVVTFAQQAGEKSRGLNGVLTEIGTSVKNLTDYATTQSGPIKQMTDEQKIAVEKLNDEMENSGTDAETMATNMASLLTSFGYSADEIDALWSATASGINETKDQTEFWKAVVEKMPETVEKANSRIDLSNVTTKDAVSKLTEAWDANSSQLGITGKALDNMNAALTPLIGETLSAKDAYDQMKEACERLHVPVEALDTLFGIAFPEAVSTGMTNASTAAESGNTRIGGALSSIEGGFKAASGSIGTEMDSIKRSTGDGVTTMTGHFTRAKTEAKLTGTAVGKHLSEGAKEGGEKLGELGRVSESTLSKIATNSGTNMATTKSNITTNTEKAKGEATTAAETMNTEMTKSFGEVSKNADTKFSELKANIVRNLGQIKTDANTHVDELSKYLHERFGNIAKNLPNHFSTIGEDIGGHFDSVQGSVKSHTKASAIEGDFGTLKSNIVKKFNTVCYDIAQKFDSLDGNIKSHTETYIIESFFSTAKNNIVGKFDTVSSDIANKFSGLHWDIDRAIDYTSIYNIGQNITNKLQQGLGSVVLSIPHIEWSWTRLEYGPADNRQWFEVPDLSVKWYAKGGFPDFGELFVANEKGPELVGTMGNRNVVANNKQITDGIRAAAFEGFVNAFQATVGANKGTDGNPTFNIYFSGERVTDVVIKDINQRTIANGVSPLII